MQYLKWSLIWQFYASIAMAVLWLVGARAATIGHPFDVLFGTAVFVGALAIICASYALAQNQWGLIGPALVFVISALVATNLHQLGIMLFGASLYAAWARANFVYEKTSGDTPILPTFFVSFPVAALYVLIEPGAYGFLKDHGLGGLAERPWIPFVPSVALLVAQGIVVSGRRSAPA